MREASNMELLVAVVIASFVGSLHCVGMCGPLVAFAVGDPTARRRASRAWLHAAYHGGRLSTYALVGAVCGVLGAAVDHGGARLGCHRAAALLAGTMMIAVGLAAVLRAVGVRLPQAPLPRMIQRLILAGQRAAFALTPLPRALSTGLLTAFSALRLALSVRLEGGGDRQPASGRAVHDRFLAGQRAGIAPGRASACRRSPGCWGGACRWSPRWQSSCWAFLRSHSGCSARAGLRARVKIQADAASVKQVEEIGASVPPCCRKDAAAEKAP